MSLFELLLIIIVGFLVLKPEDIPKILTKIRQVKSFITDTKQEIMAHIDPRSDSSSKKPKFEDLDLEMEQMNFYLEKIANLDSEYEGEYSLPLIKDHYRKLVKNKMHDELKSKEK
jgi:Sec-independent protein translocase protein TatA